MGTDICSVFVTVDEDFGIPTGCCNPGGLTSGFLVPYSDFDDIFLVISSFFDYSVFFMVIENDLAGHASRYSGEKFSTHDGI